MKQKIIPVNAWAKKNNLSGRTVRRMILDGRIPVKDMAVYIKGIPENFKIQK